MEIPKLEEFKDARSAFIKARLWDQVAEAELSTFQRSLYPVVANYMDAFIACREKGNENEIIDMLSLHTINHVLKARDTVMKHNNKLKRASMENLEAPDFKDQGYTRPRVLVILPFRSSVVKFMDSLIAWLPESMEINQKKRFDEEFGEESDSENEEDTTKIPTNTPEWKYVFNGNTDDW